MDRLDFELKHAIQNEESERTEHLQAKAQFRVLLDYKYNKFSKLIFLIGPEATNVGGRDFPFDLFWPYEVRKVLLSFLLTTVTQPLVVH